jgi:hypothetical protein
MVRTRLFKAAGLLVLGGAIVAVALITLAIRSQHADSNQANPAVAVPAGAAAGSVQTGSSASSTDQPDAPVQRVITPGQLAPVQAPVQAPVGAAAAGVLPDPHGPASTKPIHSVAPIFGDRMDGAPAGFAPLVQPAGPAPGGAICSAQKNCR